MGQDIRVFFRLISICLTFPFTRSWWSICKIEPCESKIEFGANIELRFRGGNAETIVAAILSFLERKFYIDLNQVTGRVNRVTDGAQTILGYNNGVAVQNTNPNFNVVCSSTSVSTCCAMGSS